MNNVDVWNMLNSGYTFAILLAIAVSVWILILKKDTNSKRSKTIRR